VTPEEHIRMAEVYLARAEKGTTSGDGLAYIGEPGWERHINCYTRLATVHMQMASTKALLESTKQSAIATEIRALMSEHKGTVTGRMYAKAYGRSAGPCDSVITRNGKATWCRNLLDSNGTCPVEFMHDQPYPPSDPLWTKYWDYWMTVNETDEHPDDWASRERQEDFDSWRVNGMPTGLEAHPE
jgi:hypothetical protein